MEIHTRMECFFKYQRSRAARARTVESVLGIMMQRNMGAAAASALSALQPAPVATEAPEDESERLPFLDLRVSLSVESARPIEIWIDTLAGVGDGAVADDPLAPLRFLFLIEPDEVTGMAARVDARCFHTVFAHNPAVLRDDARFPRSARFEHGGTWILARDFNATADAMAAAKLRAAAAGSGLVSFICGSKRLTRGHRIRHALWRAQNELHDDGAVRAVFFHSSAAKDAAFLRALVPNPRVPPPVLGARPQEKVNTLKAFCFHIAIENVAREGYFSEKLLDCFLTRTVPVYWGDPAIASYFDVSGMVLVGEPRGGGDSDDVAAGGDLTEDLAVDLSEDLSPQAAATRSEEAVAARIVDLLRAGRCSLGEYERIAASGAIERNYAAAKRWINLEARMSAAISGALASG